MTPVCDCSASVQLPLSIAQEDASEKVSGARFHEHETALRGPHVLVRVSSSQVDVTLCNRGSSIQLPLRIAQEDLLLRAVLVLHTHNVPHPLHESKRIYGVATTLRLT